MWLLVMFDLPVKEPAERKAAARFRFDLLDLGFTMAQYSVYLRCCASRDAAEPLTVKVEGMLPSGGTVSILQFTDKQYEQMIVYFGRGKDKRRKNPEQLALF